MASIDFEVKKFDTLTTKLYEHKDKEVVNLTSLIDDVMTDIKTEYESLQEDIQKLKKRIEHYEEAMHTIKQATDENFD